MHCSELQQSLNAITTDLMGRLMEGDHTILSGVTKFIRTYDAMKQSHSPTPAIAYALHNFGRPDSKFTLTTLVSNNTVFPHPKQLSGFVQARGHIGRYIKTNSTIRRRKALPRGTKQAPQGRPTKRPLQEPNYFPPKAKRPKKPHCLNLNIRTREDVDVTNKP